ncbi:MAG: response regulator [Burkholderiales bacterium]|nr:response regulator [Burkholderiales bacterium]MCZ2135652.1 response regulator [Burkholderiales bacterium]
MALFDFFRRRPAPDAPHEVATVEVGTPTAPPERRRRARASVAPGTQILIVDDSKTMVAALGRMLRENGFDILEAFDGEQALELLRKNKPSLIFLDIVLPGMTGFDVLRRVRRSQYVGKVPIIMMSGNEAATEEYYVKRIGADEFMSKPCTRAAVFSRVERLLNLVPNALDDTNVATGGPVLAKDH